jgi:hypothetical protein
MTMLPGTRIQSDNGTPYEHKKQKVLVASGQFDGMRFDTDGSGQLEPSTTQRRVRLDFSGTSNENDQVLLRGVDFRFDNQVDPLGLCEELPNVGNTGQVNAGMNFYSFDGVSVSSLKYGGTGHGGHDCEAQGVSRLTATRTKKYGIAGSTTDEWEVVSGPTACLYGRIGETVGFVAVVPMQIHFTLRAQSSVP